MKAPSVFRCEERDLELGGKESRQDCLDHGPKMKPRENRWAMVGLNGKYVSFLPMNLVFDVFVIIVQHVHHCSG